jgi:hypothetical protein
MNNIALAWHNAQNCGQKIYKPNYTPHVDCGDNVIIINAEKIRFTGKKMEDKVYTRHTGYPGGQRFATPKELIKKNPKIGQIQGLKQFHIFGLKYTEILSSKVKDLLNSEEEAIKKKKVDTTNAPTPYTNELATIDLASYAASLEERIKVLEEAKK